MYAGACMYVNSVSKTTYLLKAIAQVQTQYDALLEHFRYSAQENRSSFASKNAISSSGITLL